MTLAEISARVTDADPSTAESAAGAKLSALPLLAAKGAPGPPANEKRRLLPAAGPDTQTFVLNTDKVNRFLLCVLVIDSAKKIKVRALDLGEDLPLPTVIRAVLKSSNATTAHTRVSLPLSHPNPSH